MQIIDIIRNHLKENEFDGLVTDDNGCGCTIDDLAPCDSYFGSCHPGYAVPCDCGGSCGVAGVHISTEKQDDNAKA